MSWVGGKTKEKRSASRHGDKFWEEEKTNYGFKMMSKMGWAQGQGLGVNGEGMKSYLQTKRKHDNLGIGATQSQSDETWIATQSMYNDILKKLQIGGVGDGAPKTADEPEKTERSTAATLKATLERRRLYSRFTQAKDVSSYSDQSMSEILGRTASNSNSTSSSSSSSSSSGGAGGVGPEAVDELGRPIEVAETSSLVTVTSTVSLTDYFSQRVSECLSKIKNTTEEDKTDDFSDRRGFSTQDQLNYYDQMMQMTNNGRGGLGAGAGRNREEEEIAYYAARKKPSAATEYYNDRNSLLRKLAGSSDKKPKEWGMSTALPTAEAVTSAEAATFRRAVINRPGQAKFTAYEASHQEKESGKDGVVVCEELNDKTDRKRGAKESDKSTKRVCTDSKSTSTSTRRSSLTPLSDKAHEEIHTIVQKHIKKGDGIVPLKQLLKRVTKKGRVEEYGEDHLAQYLASKHISKKVVIALAKHAVHADDHHCEHYRAVHKVFRKVSDKTSSASKSSKKDKKNEAEEAELVALPLTKLSSKLKKHLPDHILEIADETEHELGPAVTSLATLARTAGDYILISFHTGEDE